jgi:hypothetical protein
MRGWSAAAVVIVITGTAWHAAADSPPAAPIERLSEQADADGEPQPRGLGALESGMPLVRWPNYGAALVPVRTFGIAGDDRGGIWVRLGVDGATAAPASASASRTRSPFTSAHVTAPFPFFTLVNSDDLFGQLFVRAGARMSLHAEYHVLRLSDPTSLWYGIADTAGVHDRPIAAAASTNRRELAHLIGVGLSVTLSEHLAMEAQYGHAVGPALAERGFAGAAAHYGYLELTFRY